MKICTQFLLSICLSIVPMVVWAEDQLTIEVNKPIYTWRVHPSSERIFGASFDTNEIIEFNSSAETVRRFSVAEGPAEIVFKGNLLVAACTKGKRLQLIDLDQNNIAGEISLDGKSPFGLCCSEVDNPYVYCFCDSSANSSEIVQCDLQKMSVVSKQKTGRNEILVASAAMSSDGKLLVLSPDGTAPIILLSVDENNGKFRSSKALRDLDGVIGRDADSQFWCARGFLYPVKGSPPIQRFSGKVATTIHSPSNLVASLGKETLYIESLSDSKRIARIPIKSLSAKEIESNDPIYRFPRGVPRKDLQFLPSSKKVLYGDSLRGHLIPYGSAAASNLQTANGTSVDAGKEEFNHVHTSENVKSWVVDSQTGRVFAAFEEDDVVVEFDSKGNELRRLPTSGGPTELLIKNDCLAVLCARSNRITVYQLTDNKLRGEIKLLGFRLGGLCGSRVKNDWVYAFSFQSPQGDAEFFKCNLKNLSAKSMLQPNNRPIADRAVMSPDGKWVLSGFGNDGRWGSLILRNVNESWSQLSEGKGINTVKPIQTVNVDASSRYWLLGNTLLTIDLTRQERVFAQASAIAMHPEQDLIATFHAQQLKLEKRSDGQLLEEIKLPIEASILRFPLDRQREDSTGAASYVGFDLHNNFVFVGTARGGYWVPLGDRFKALKVESFAKQETSFQGVVGTPLKIPIQLERTSTSPKLSIKASPQGVELVDGAIVWTPMRNQVGNAEVSVDLLSESGSTIDSLYLKIEVNLPQLSIGFNAKSASFSPNGRFLAVVGGHEGNLPVPEKNIAVIDVETSKIIGQQVVPDGINAAAIDDRYVYLSAGAKKFIFRTKHDFSDFKSATVDATPIYLSCAIAGNLIVTTERGVNDEINVVETDKLDELSKLSPQSLMREAVATDLNVAVLNNKTVRVGHVLFDRQLGTRLAITQSAKLRSIQIESTPKNWAQGIEKGTWGYRNASEADYFRLSNLTINANQQLAILSTYPMAALLDNQKSVERSIDGRGAVFVSRTTLKCVDLANSVELDEIVVSDTRGTQPQIHQVKDWHLLWDHAKIRSVPAMSSDRIVLASGGRVVLLNLPDGVKVKEVIPLPQLHVPDSLVVPVEDQASIPINCVMDSGCALQIAGFLPGLTVTSQNHLEIDMPKLWQGWLTQAAKDRQLVNEVVELNPKLSFEKNEKLFKSLVGREHPADKVALQVEVPFVIKNQEVVVTRLNFSMVALGPRKAFLKAIGQN